MKRDWNLIRDILVECESQNTENFNLQPNIFKKYEFELVNYHFGLMKEAGLVKVQEIPIKGECLREINRITWEGHEFLNKIRDQNVWQKTQEILKNKGIELTFDSVKQAGTYAIQALLQ